MAYLQALHLLINVSVNDYTDSDVTSTAFYIQDVWTVTDQLVLNGGLRYSNVANTICADGRKYVDVT